MKKVRRGNKEIKERGEDEERRKGTKGNKNLRRTKAEIKN